MRLTILGGSAASPNPGAGCSGYLISSGSTVIYVDPGPGTLQELRRHADFRTLNSVIVSHMHIDHMLDLLALRHALAYNPVQPPAPVPVWLPPGGATFLAAATAPFDTCDRPGRFDETVVVREFAPASCLKIGELAIQFRPTIHDIPAWAMRISGPNRSIGYTADGGPASDLTGLFAGVDLLLAEATLLEPGSSDSARGSLTAREAGALATTVKSPRLVLTHLWEERGLDAARAEAATAYSGPIDLARPGLTIDL